MQVIRAVSSATPSRTPKTMNRVKYPVLMETLIKLSVLREYLRLEDDRELVRLRVDLMLVVELVESISVHPPELLKNPGNDIIIVVKTG